MIIAVSLFTYFSALGFLMSIVWSFKNENAYKMLSTAAGQNLSETSATSEPIAKAMKFLLMDFTSQMMGFNLFALFILWFPFRNGELWAWYILWFYPLMFAWHYFHYAKGTSFSKVQIVYCLISAASLILTFSNFN